MRPSVYHFNTARVYQCQFIDNDNCSFIIIIIFFLLEAVFEWWLDKSARNLYSDSANLMNKMWFSFKLCPPHTQIGIIFLIWVQRRIGQKQQSQESLIWEIKCGDNAMMDVQCATSNIRSYCVVTNDNNCWKWIFDFNYRFDIGLMRCAHFHSKW